MCKFNIGDKIVYIGYENNLSFYDDFFKKYNTYTIVQILNNGITFGLGIKEIGGYYSSNYFITLIEYRKLKLQKLELL